MRKLIVIIGLLIAAQSASASDWTKADTTRQLIFTGLQIIDWAQTRQALDDGYIETNPLLGERPSARRIDGHSAFTTIANALISYALPPDYRHVWQYVMIGMQASTVVRNYSIGVRITF